MDNFNDSETQEPDDAYLLQFGSETQEPQDAPSTLVLECKNYYWKVKLIDGNGTIEDKTMTTKDVWKFTNHRVMVHFDEETGQPDEDSAGLLVSYLGQLSGDVSLLPIDYTDWRKYHQHRKETAWKLIQTKFWFDNPERRQKYVISVLGSRCKDLKVRIWKTYKRQNKQETLNNCPKAIPNDQWKSFVEERYSDKWKKMQLRNINNQKKNVIPHACGRKSFARKRKEIFNQTGKKSCRADFFIESRKKNNGNFVNDLAKEKAELLQDLMSQQPAFLTENHGVASLDDDYAIVFGKERSGRVRCVGRGPTPSKFLNRSGTTMPLPEPANTEMVGQLRSQVTVLQTQLQNLTGFLQYIGATAVQPTGMLPNFGAITQSIATPPDVGALNPSIANAANFGAITPSIATPPDFGAIIPSIANPPNFGATTPSIATPPNFATMLSAFLTQPFTQAMNGRVVRGSEHGGQQNGYEHGGQQNGADHGTT